MNQATFQTVRHLNEANLLNGTEQINGNEQLNGNNQRNGTDLLNGNDQQVVKVNSSDISRVMAIMGRRGGRIGGKRRLITMTPEQRRKVAQKAAQARWANHKHER